tara:strand:+ start:166 stop:558 length:393 start_codon:yes stop_codon:yes gene_type:complete
MMEVELIGEFEKNELPMTDTIFMFQLLVDRGWVWKMAAEYQAYAVAYLNLGIIKPARKDRENVQPMIRILTKDGKIDRILTEGVINVFVEDETGVTAKYTTVDIGKFDDDAEAAPHGSEASASPPPVEGT